jgi:capsular exopolysaccharide synthesis family protein
VLIIEADLRNPSLHKVMGLKAEVGLSNLLAGAASMAEVTLDTDDDRMKIILAGPLPPNPAELLSGSKFISMLTVACDRYDQVIIDGPPVLGLADSPILANAVEGTLMVVTSGKTKIGTGQAALKRLIAARARITGALLTKYDAKIAGYGYYYDSHYAYGENQRLTRS